VGGLGGQFSRLRFHTTCIVTGVSMIMGWGGEGLVRQPMSCGSEQSYRYVYPISLYCDPQICFPTVTGMVKYNLSSLCALFTHQDFVCIT